MRDGAGRHPRYGRSAGGRHTAFPDELADNGFHRVVTQVQGVGGQADALEGFDPARGLEGIEHGVAPLGQKRQVAGLGDLRPEPMPERRFPWGRQ
ncbi:MAG TPA: hypothetical protein EYP90_07460, partial [Chromatiaceae bacterium]|nr:hypothetical protein [Chromatiaceae bacterium]